MTFTVKDNSGAAVPLSSLNNLSLLMSGPTTDYGNTSFGADVTTVGYVSESATTAAQCGTDGVCVYTFNHAVPAGAHGTFAIGIEGRRTETLLPGTVTQMDVQYGGDNKVAYFSVDGSPVQPRRQVTQVASCNQCHFDLDSAWQQSQRRRDVRLLPQPVEYRRGAAAQRHGSCRANQTASRNQFQPADSSHPYGREPEGSREELHGDRPKREHQ